MSRIVKAVSGPIQGAVAVPARRSAAAPLTDTAWVFPGEVVDTLAITPQDTNPWNAQFNEDGTRLFVAGITNQKIYEYDCPTPYSLAGVSFTSASTLISEMNGASGTHFFSADGFTLTLTDLANLLIRQFTLSTAFDVDSRGSVTNFALGPSFSAVSGFSFSSDGAKLYVAGETAAVGQGVIEYDTAAPFHAVGSLLVGVLDVAAGSPNATYVAISDEGKYLYTSDSTNRRMCQWRLPAQFEIADAEFLSFLTLEFSLTSSFMIIPDATRMFSIRSQTLQQQEIFFGAKS